MVIVNEHDNHDRQRLDSSLVYIGAHNVYYVKSCLSDAKCFSGSRYSFRVQELKPLLFHNWPVHGESGYTVKPPTGDTNEQTQFIDYFNLFYSKRGQEQISISQQLGNYGTTFFSASRQILPYSARLKSTQKSVNPGLVRASATFTLEFQ